jgi:hypothetical protein
MKIIILNLLVLVITGWGCSHAQVPVCSRNEGYYFIRDNDASFGFGKNKERGDVAFAARYNRGGIFGDKGSPRLETLSVEYIAPEWVVLDRKHQRIVGTTDKMCGDAIIAAINEERERVSRAVSR